jgi:hypothetical protein
MHPDMALYQGLVAIVFLGGGGEWVNFEMIESRKNSQKIRG